MAVVAPKIQPPDYQAPIDAEFPRHFSLAWLKWFATIIQAINALLDTVSDQQEDITVIQGEIAGLAPQVAAVVTTQFDVTSSSVLADVPGLSRTVSAGITYIFRAELYTTADPAGGGGVKIAISGAATASQIIYDLLLTDSSSLTYFNRAFGLNSPLGVTSVNDFQHLTIVGTIFVATGGTLTVQFAQNLSDVTPSSVLVGSSFRIEARGE